MKNALVLGLFATILWSCVADETPVMRKIRYEIGCTDCMVVYVNEDSTQVTEYEKNSTWTYEFDAKPGVYLLLAYNTGDVPQGVTARMLVDGVVTKEATHFCPISGYSFVADTIE